MRKFFALSMAVIVLGASSACGPSQSNRGDESTEAERQQALRDSAFGSAAEALDRARRVEQLQRDRQRELNEAIEGSQGR
ncbi:MAG: hypothetical protein V3S94_09585 [Gammaproteobacteria bacterium]